MGLEKKARMFSSSASLESIDPGDIQGAAEGVYFFENFPRMLAYKNDEYHKEFNRLIGIDDVYCREIGGSRVMDKSHGWQAWEDIFAIKQAVETSGYKTRRDIEGAILALEGMQMKNSLAHPQGDKLIRKEDHAGVIDCYISRVENGRFEVKKRISKEELLRREFHPNAKVEINRFKGLGEMMANQLKETTMDPKKRTLLRVVVLDDARKRTDGAVEQLMGNKPEGRFAFIQERAEFADEEMLDV